MPQPVKATATIVLMALLSACGSSSAGSRVTETSPRPALHDKCAQFDSFGGDLPYSKTYKWYCGGPDKVNPRATVTFSLICGTHKLDSRKIWNYWVSDSGVALGLAEFPAATDQINITLSNHTSKTQRYSAWLSCKR